MKKTHKTYQFYENNRVKGIFAIPFTLF